MLFCRTKNYSIIEKFLIIIFLNFISFSICQSYDNQIFLYSDQVDHSTYIASDLFPNSYSDLKIGAIMADGSMMIPVGIYMLESFKDTTGNDTTAIKNFFKWKQGDYLFREINIGSRYNYEKNYKIELLALGRSYAGRSGLQGPSEYNYKGNVLQNYYINFHKDYESSELMTSFLYHIENTGLPFNNNIFNYRETESLHFGFEYLWKINNYKYLISFKQQIGEIEYDLIFNNFNYQFNFEQFTTWLNFNGIYKNTDYSEYIINFNNKRSLIEPLSTNVFEDISEENEVDGSLDPSDHNYNINDNSLSIKYHYFKFSYGLEYELKFNDEIIYPCFKFYKKYSLLKISLSNNIITNHSLSTYYHFHKKYIKFIDLEFVIKNKNFFQRSSILFFNQESMPFLSKIRSIGILNYLSYNNSWVTISLKSNNYSNKELKINRYNYTSLNLHPMLWWTDRYKFIFGLELHHSEVASIDPPLGQNIFNKKNNMYINWSIGLEVKNFQLTYSKKFLSKNDIIISDVLNPLYEFSYLTIDWNFID